MYTITDQNTGQTATVEQREDVVETIAPWFPDAPAEVTDALASLHDALQRHEYTGDLEAFLGVKID